MRKTKDTLTLCKKRRWCMVNSVVTRSDGQGVFYVTVSIIKIYLPGNLNSRYNELTYCICPLRPCVAWSNMFMVSFRQSICKMKMKFQRKLMINTIFNTLSTFSPLQMKGLTLYLKHCLFQSKLQVCNWIDILATLISLQIKDVKGTCHILAKMTG